MVKKKKVLLTKEGLKQLEQEHLHLKDEVMKEIAQKIKEAKEFGDLSENSEYIEAKEHQAATAARIIEIENMLRNVEIIDEKKAAKSNTVQLGSNVTVRALDTKEKEKEEYTIVGSTEADPFNGKISNESPLGKALIGKKEKDKVEFKAPKGMREYELLKVA
jgi:transcription elongation factor GreA